MARGGGEGRGKVAELIVKWYADCGSRARPREEIKLAVGERKKYTKSILQIRVALPVAEFRVRFSHANGIVVAIRRPMRKDKNIRSSNNNMQMNVKSKLSGSELNLELPYGIRGVVRSLM